MPRFQRVKVSVLGRYMLADRREFPCQVLEMSPGDARVIAHTKIIGGGQTTSVTFPTSKLKKGEAYTFFCSFPGHWSIMKGAFKFG